MESVIINNRYVLGRKLPNGRMSTIYEAVDRQRRNRKVAVKLLNSPHPDAIRKELFRRETRALELLDHPNIVVIEDSGYDEKQQCFFIVLEWLGETLLDILKRHPDPVDRDWCWPIVRSLADALVHAHAAGVLHRDIKPANILFDDSGTPKLSDFGISSLLYELSTGQTVANFYSVGYASPEQRTGGVIDAHSDLYSFGAVIYHLLSRQEPPADGPTPELVVKLSTPPVMKKLLSQLLARRPESRPEDAAQVRRLCELQEKNAAPLSEVFLLVTDQAKRDLYRLGQISSLSDTEMCEWVVEALGGHNVDPVPMTLERNGEIRFHTLEHRLRCTRVPLQPVLLISGVEQPYPPNHEAARASGRPVRALWQPIPAGSRPEISDQERASLEVALREILDQAHTHNKEAVVARERRQQQRSLLDTWERVLRYQRQILQAASHPLTYIRVSREQDLLVFRLSGAAPDTLSWSEGEQLAVADSDGRKQRAVGSLIRVVGDQVVVSPEGSRLGDRDIPSAGTLSLYLAGSAQSLRRQQDALFLLRAGEAGNKRLIEVLTNLGGAEFDEPDMGVVFVQSDLAEDKREAVRRALSTRDIFLIQGPPGTGKTTVITEIILQILRRQPDARILVSSQSNVAVNHVLSRLGDVPAKTSLEIVRLGRAEKISQGAEEWQIDERLKQWADQVVVHCEAVRKELQRKSRQSRGERQISLPPALEQSLTVCQERLEEASEWLSILQGEEDRYAALASIPVPNEGEVPSVSISAELAALADAILTERENLQRELGSICVLLPEEARGTPLPILADELARLRDVIAAVSEPEAADDQTRELRKLLQDWKLVFGRTDEFRAPLIQRANVVGATCLVVGARDLKDDSFEWVIVDEAGRATAPELLVALVRGKRAILVGDERQLPPMLDESLNPERLVQAGITDENDLSRSLFETLARSAEEAYPEALHLLTSQHRMSPSIGKLVSEVFYDGQLSHAVTAEERAHGVDWLPTPVVWISTSNMPQHNEERRGLSFANRAEVAVIEALLLRLETHYRAREIRPEVGIIAGYAGQIADLVRQIAPDDRHRWQALQLEVATVDGFQGRDRDIILYSAVRSNQRRAIGFLKDRRRLNVALSRARQLLVIIGDSLMLGTAEDSQGRNPFADVLAYIDQHPDDCTVLEAGRFSTNGED